MQYQPDASTVSQTPTRFQMVRARLRKALLIVILTAAAYSRLNAAPHPNTDNHTAHQHHPVISRTLRA